MSVVVKDVSLNKFERLVKIFEKSILIMNFGYRKPEIRFINLIFPLLFIISTAFNVYQVTQNYNSSNRIKATYTIVFIAVHIQSVGKSLMVVLNFSDFETIFVELRKFYVDKPHPIIVKIRNHHNLEHIRGITYGVM